MKNIIEDNGKFAVKEIDESGNSLGTGPERFDTKEEAQAFIDGAEGEATEEAPVDEPVVDDPASRGAVDEGQALAESTDGAIGTAPEGQATAGEAGAVNTENNDTIGQA